MADDGTTVSQNQYGSYQFSPDQYGQYSINLAANQKTLVSTSFSVMGDADSQTKGVNVFFSSYANLITEYGPPVLPVDENGIIQVSSEDPYIIVGLPSTTASFRNFPTAQAALLVNGTTFVSDSYRIVFDEGFRVPVNMLSEDTPNRFGYTIVNGATSVSPVTAYANVEGEIITRPPPSPLRTLTESPYLLNHAAVVIDATRDTTVFIDYPADNPDGLNIGDKITMTVYINAWLQGSNIPNNTIFSLDPFLIQVITKNQITATIPKGKLAGFGMNSAGRPGTIYIDYTLTKKGSNDVSALPITYYTGLINTVGPI